MGRLWGMVCVWHGRAARMPNGVQCAPTSLSCSLEGGGRPMAHSLVWVGVEMLKETQ